MTVKAYYMVLVDDGMPSADLNHWKNISWHLVDSPGTKYS
jgi:hypothetical protein